MRAFIPYWGPRGKGSNGSKPVQTNWVNATPMTGADGRCSPTNLMLDCGASYMRLRSGAADSG